MKKPLVSVICLAYNHEKYIIQALQSVVNQSYNNIEMIVVDDASTDKSQALITQFAKKYPKVQTILLPKNVGNCKAFNIGFRQSNGKYIIDFATDDLLHPNRITKQVTFFENLDDRYGVIFSDALLINAQGHPMRTFHKRDTDKNLVHIPPSGNIYKHIIGKSYICTPTMMIHRSVLEYLQGYDETLSYEDYDFWVRSSRHFWYGFQDEILTSKRILNTSHGASFYRKGKNPHLKSTFNIHQKAFELNKNAIEHQALSRSVQYHLRLALYTENFELMPLFADLLRKLNHFRSIDKLFLWAGNREISVSKWYIFYRNIHKFH